MSCMKHRDQTHSYFRLRSNIMSYNVKCRQIHCKKQSVSLIVARAVLYIVFFVYRLCHCAKLCLIGIAVCVSIFLRGWLILLVLRLSADGWRMTRILNLNKPPLRQIHQRKLWRLSFKPHVPSLARFDRNIWHVFVFVFARTNGSCNS